MSVEQWGCLIGMFIIGGWSGGLAAEEWDDLPRRHRIAAIAWVAFWLVPPFYFLWTKGTMG